MCSAELMASYQVLYPRRYSCAVILRFSGRVNVVLHGAEVKGWGCHGDHSALVFTGGGETSNMACFSW